MEEKPNINTTLPKLMRMNLKKMKESLTKVKNVKSAEKCVTCPTNCVTNSSAKPSRKCESCGNYEHNKCYDPEGKKGALIQSGHLEFNCTKCCIKDPNLVTKKPVSSNKVNTFFIESIF